MAKEVHVIYTIAGNLPYVYNPVKWKFRRESPNASKRKRQEDDIFYEPLSAVALAKHLLKKNKDVELKVLVPHSVFFNQDENLKDLEKLKNSFKEAILNYFKNKYESLLKIQKLESFLPFLEAAIFNTEKYKAQLQELYSEIQKIVSSKEEENIKIEKIKEMLKDLIEKINEDYKSSLENGKHKIDISVKIIPSYGIYKGKITLDYRSIQVYERVLYNYLIFVEDFLKYLNENKKVFIYLDTSIGSNTFLVEALEAFNSAITFWNFYFLEEKYSKKEEENNKEIFYILSAEPVIGSPNLNDVKHFSIEPINRIAFFKKPLTWKDFKENIKEKLEIKNEPIERAVKEGIYLFNVIKYNLPLALLINPIPENKKNKIDKNKPLEVKYLSENEIFNRINNLIKLVKPKLDFSFKENEQKYLYIKLNYENIKKVENAYFTYTKIKNLTFLLMLYANLVKNLYQVPKGNTIKDLRLSFLQNYNRIDLIKYENDDSESIKCRSFKVKKVYKPNPNIAKVFSTLAEKYGLLINTIFLDKEWINQTKKLSCFINSYFLENGVCKYFAEIEKLNNNEDDNRSPYNGDPNINPRNFLAHLGFENNITRLCKDDKGYYIEYDEKVLNKIYEFILNDFKTEKENENQSQN
jgi:hypothetical protein